MSGATIDVEVPDVPLLFSAATCGTESAIGPREILLFLRDFLDFVLGAFRAFVSSEWLVGGGGVSSSLRF